MKHWILTWGKNGCAFIAAATMEDAIGVFRSRYGHQVDGDVGKSLKTIRPINDFEIFVANDSDVPF